MPVFKEMDPELVRKAIEGYTDELTPAARVQESYQRQFRCPNCRSELVKDFNHPARWSGEGLLAKFLLRCELCDYTVEPDTGLIIRTGNPAQVPEELRV